MSSFPTVVTTKRHLTESLLLLLVLPSILLGATSRLTQLADKAGWSPIAFTFWVALGGGRILLIAGRAARQHVSTAWRSTAFSVSPCQIAWPFRDASARHRHDLALSLFIVVIAAGGMLVSWRRPQ